MRRPTWLWPFGFTLLWILAPPLALILWASGDKSLLLPEVQKWIEMLAKQPIPIIWLAVLILLTIGTYVGSFLTPRTKRPRVRVTLMMVAWSLVLGGWWYGANRGTPEDILEWAVLVVCVIAPPTLLLVIESATGSTLIKSGRRRFKREDYEGAVTLLKAGHIFRPDNKRLVKQIGECYFHLHRWGPAEEWLREVRRITPSDHEVVWPLAEMALRRKEWNEAIPLISEHLDLHPRDERAWLQLCDAYLAINKIAKAVEAYEHIEHGESIERQARLVELYLRQGDRLRALKAAQRIRAMEPAPHEHFVKFVERILDADPTMMVALEAMAQHAEELGRPADLHHWREQILSLRPADTKLRRQIMEYHRKKNEVHRVEKHLQVLLEGENPDKEDLLEMIDLVMNRRSWDDLGKWLDLAREHFPEAWEFILIDAQLALEHGEHERCFKLCHMARARTTNPEGLRRVENMMTRLERDQSASRLQALREAISKSDNPVPLRWELVEKLIVLGSIDTIAAELDEILRSDPDQAPRVDAMLEDLLQKNPFNYALLHLHRDLQLKRGDYDGVFETSKHMAKKSMTPEETLREAAEMILQTCPDHVLSLRWLSDHSLKSGDPERAVDLSRRWLAADPEAHRSPDNLQRLFDALCRNHDLEGAIEVSKVLAEAQHRTYDNLRALAALYQHHGQLVEAQVCLRQALEIDDSDPAVHRAIRQLDEQMQMDRIQEVEDLIAQGRGTPALHREVGDLLYEMGRHTEAIKHLQRAADDPAQANICKAKIAHALGLRGLLDLAHETIEEVVLESADARELDMLKAIHYDLAVMFLEDKKRDRARDIFKAIFRVDAGFRDVVERLERMKV